MTHVDVRHDAAFLTHVDVRYVNGPLELLHFSSHAALICTGVGVDYETLKNYKRFTLIFTFFQVQNFSMTLYLYFCCFLL